MHVTDVTKIKSARLGHWLVLGIEGGGAAGMIETVKETAHM